MKPDVARSGIHLGDVARAPLAVEGEGVAVGVEARRQIESIDRPPPRTAASYALGLAYASAMTADAPALMKPAAKLSTRSLAWPSVPSATPGSRVALA